MRAIRAPGSNPSRQSARRGSDRLFKLADADGALLPSRPQLDDDRIERGRSLVEKVGEVASAAHETRPYPAVVP